MYPGIAYVSGAAIDTITLKTSRRRRRSRSSDTHSRNNWFHFFKVFIRMKSVDKYMFPMQTSVCSASEYRILINGDAGLNPNVILVNML